MEQASIAVNVAKLNRRIETICAQLNRDPREVNVIGVSKRHPASSVLGLAEAGIYNIGENYAQELFEKAHELRNQKRFNWHFIGQLQSNKIKKLVSTCSTIHTVASIKHMEKIAQSVREQDRQPFPIFLSVNIDNENRKGGCGAEEVKPLIEAARSMEELSLLGLMAVPKAEFQDSSWSTEERGLPSSYARLRDWTAEFDLKYLSLGMSGDLHLALSAGSTHVRVGTALLGPRPN